MLLTWKFYVTYDFKQLSFLLKVETRSKIGLRSLFYGTAQSALFSLLAVYAASMNFSILEISIVTFLVAISGIMDIFDGALARKMNLNTDKGAFLDSTFDRLSESVILVALIYFFTKENELNAVILSSASLVFSLLISYLRARLEGLGYNSKSGFFTRPERILVVTIGLIFFIEGLLIAIFPSRIKSMLELIKNTPENKLRTFGVIFLVIGFLIIWYIKS